MARRANNSANIDNNERIYAERADSVSGLPESVATPSQTRTPIAQLDDIAAQRLKPPQIQNEFTEAAVNGRDLNNDLSDLIHTQPLQELSSSWQDFLVGAKNHIGAYPMQRDKQEVDSAWSIDRAHLGLTVSIEMVNLCLNLKKRF